MCLLGHFCYCLKLLAIPESLLDYDNTSWADMSEVTNTCSNDRKNLTLDSGHCADAAGWTVLNSAVHMVVISIPDSVMVLTNKKFRDQLKAVVAVDRLMETCTDTSTEHACWDQRPKSQRPDCMP